MPNATRAHSPAHTGADRYVLNTYSYTLEMDAASCLRHLAARGARGVELMLYPGHVWVDTPGEALREIRQVATGEGLTLSSLNTVNLDLNIAAASAEMRAHSLALVERFVRIAGELGAPAFVLGPGKANPLLALPQAQLRGFFFAALDRLLPLARAHDVAIQVENMPFAFLPGMDGLMQALDDYGCDEVGVVCDAANAHFVGEAPAESLRRAGRRLRLLHLSDTRREQYRHAPIGEGDVDFAALGQAVAEVALNTAPVLEIISSNPDEDLFQAPERLRHRGFFWEGLG